MHGVIDAYSSDRLLAELQDMISKTSFWISKEGTEPSLVHRRASDGRIRGHVNGS